MTNKVIKGLKDSLSYQRCEEIGKVLQFYADVDCKANIPPDSSPALVALGHLSNVKERFVEN